MGYVMLLPDDKARRTRNLRTALALALVAVAFLAAYVIRRSLG
jgi:transcriptional regulator of met regulon